MARPDPPPKTLGAHRSQAHGRSQVAERRLALGVSNHFKRSGIELARSTMCDWMAVAAELLGPIVKRMLSLILRSRVVQNDDTTVPVQDHSGKGIKTGRLWVSIGDHDHPFTVYYLHPGPQRHRTAGDLQGLPGLSPGRRLFGLRRPLHLGRDRRSRMPDARAPEVL
jgi:hypothetical protein